MLLRTDPHMTIPKSYGTMTSSTHKITKTEIATASNS